MTENAYLVGLRLAGRRVVVVGGGSVAQRRLGLLVGSGADVHVVTRAATPAVEAMTGITLHLRDYRDGDLDGAWYAIAATDDPDVNAAVVAEAEARHVFCVRADNARFGSAVTPATFDHEGLAVGVLAAGEHRRSAAVRSAIHEAIQQGLVTVETADAAPGGVALVGGGPGDPELLTLKAIRALQSADIILSDDLVSAGVLELARREAKRMLVGKQGYGPAVKQDDINAMLVSLAGQGKHVVRLKGGDPGIFGRAGEEIEACQRAGIPVAIVPGISAAQGAAASLGLSLTHRDHARRLQFVTGHARDGKLPQDLDWKALADPAATTALYMARATLPLFREKALAAGLDPATPAIAMLGATTPAETRIASTIAELPERLGELPSHGPVLVLIGHAMGAALLAVAGVKSARG